MTLAALLLGGDDFQRSVMIASSAGFDTDSNAGCVGSLNGVRLGLDALTAQADLRAAVADRLLVVTADGGGCVSDAVREADRIVVAAARARGEEPPEARARFGFRYRGSVQGFQPCPYTPRRGSAERCQCRRHRRRPMPPTPAARPGSPCAAGASARG